MTIHLPEDLERYVQGQVHSGRFASPDDAIAEAVRLLRQRLQGQAAGNGPLSEDEWEKRLIKAGILQGPRPSGSPAIARQDYDPIQIQGEPLSETVIHERR